MIAYQSGAEAMQAALGPIVARQRAEALATFDAEMLRLARAAKARMDREYLDRAAKQMEAELAR